MALLLPEELRLMRTLPPEMMISPLESRPSASRAVSLTTVMLPPLMRIQVSASASAAGAAAAVSPGRMNMPP